MKIRFIIITFLAIVLIPLKASAQMDERKPGLYAVTGEVSIPLPYSYSGSGGWGIGIGGTGVSFEKQKYPGVTSGVNADSTFVLVVDLEKESGTVTPKKFDMFTSKITPENMMVLSLTTNEKKQCRVYDPGVKVGIALGNTSMAFNPDIKERVGFEWEMISDNSYRIKLSGLSPGEYGFIFRPPLSEWLYWALFGFTIQESGSDEQQQ